MKYLLLIFLLLCGCRKGMVEDGRIKPLQEAARMPVEGTVARGQLNIDNGEIDGRLVTGFPMPITKEILERGQERFNIYCAPCHARTGAGDGMIVQRGFPPPPTYHQKRLREAPMGYFFGVITRGYGVMYSYADRVSPEDRWAIIAYIRALQRSQNATWNDVPETEQHKITP